MRIRLASIALALVVLASPLAAVSALGQAHAASVTSFGAKCDGSSDDTSALQRAFNSVKNGGTLEFPSGKRCIITKTLSIHDAEDYAIHGNSATIQVKDGTPRGNGPFIELRRNKNATWRNLTVDGNRKNRTCPTPGSGDQKYTYHNVVISQTEDFIFDNFSSNYGCMDGLYIIGDTPSGENPSSYSRRGMFLNVRALGNHRQGMSIINAYDLEIIGGSYSFTDGDWPMAGIDIEPNPNSPKPGVKNVAIRGALFEGNMGGGLFITGVAESEDILVEGSYFKNNAVAGVRVHTRKVTVRKNLFESTDKKTTLKRYDESEMPLIYFGGVNIQNDFGEGATVVGNTFRDMNNHSQGVVYVRSRVTGSGTVRDNCFENFKRPSIKNDQPGLYTVFNNTENPANGCADPRLGAEALACHLLNASKQVPSGFGAAYNLFSADKEVLIKVECGPVPNVGVKVGSGENNLLIYNVGHEWTGAAWSEFALGGQLVSGDWLVGTASASASKSELDLQDQNFIAVYMCQFTGGTWKCGCRNTSCTAPMWSLQAYRMQLPASGPSLPNAADAARPDQGRPAAPPPPPLPPNLRPAGAPPPYPTVQVPGRAEEEPLAR